jgi:murein DD-endopeptidase MepM/ murein hydrolase activator NlpD
MVGKRQLYTLLQMIALAVLLIANGFILNFILNIDKSHNKDKCNIDASGCELTNTKSIFGFNPDEFHVNLTKVSSGQSLSGVFSQYNIPKLISDKVIKSLGEYINLNNVKSGNTIGFVGSNLCMHPDFFIYEINPSKYIISQLRGDLCVNVHERSKEYKREHAAGIIESSLWNALESQEISLDLIDQMEDALSSSVDFHHVQKGNEFKLIFDRLYIDGKPTQSSELIAAYFETDGRDNYSFSYNVNDKKGYYDMKGSPMKSKFLKAPVRFSRISSGFNLNRFHPVLKYHRPHLGTDYAAPYGTPIMAVGAGVVEAASYTGGNGNFVKIRHDKTYETQYLHMSKFASGIRRGASVSQGQTIGYVGSTGLASGPHVCFRFWKNGVQVNHRKLIFPTPDPLPPTQLPEYFKHRDELVKLFESIQFTTALNNNRNS